MQPPLVTLVLHKFSRGGSDRVAAYLARGFASAGFGVELLVFARGGEVEKELLEILGDIPVHFIRSRTGRFRALDLIAGLAGFVRHLSRRKPDVILSTANNTALVSAVGRAMAHLSKAKLVLKTTNPIVSSRHRGLVRRVRLWSYRQIFRNTAAVWTLSDEESCEMTAEFPAFAPIFRVVAQPYVTAAMMRKTKTLSSPGEKLILSIARLTAQKRVDRLLRAFAGIEFKNARLTILGDGEERESLTALTRELGVADRVDMPGYVPNVVQALHSADMFVLTSDYEGLPAAVLEAMAANCPVLSTDCFPSAQSLIGKAEGCALILDLNPKAIARQIDSMLCCERPTTLVEIASRYSVAEGSAMHVQALREALGEL